MLVNFAILILMLDEKSQENEKVTEICKNERFFNAGASRAYYSAFQLAKSFLQSYNFDYEAYLEGKSPNPSKDLFSHGTIVGALKACIQANFKKSRKRDDIESKMTLMMQLYKNRKIADYDDENITEQDFQTSLNALNEIKTSIQTLNTLPQKPKSIKQS